MVHNDREMRKVFCEVGDIEELVGKDRRDLQDKAAVLDELDTPERFRVTQPTGVEFVCKRLSYTAKLATPGKSGELLATASSRTKIDPDNDGANRRGPLSDRKKIVGVLIAPISLNCDRTRHPVAGQQRLKLIRGKAVIESRQITVDPARHRLVWLPEVLVAVDRVSLDHMTTPARKGPRPDPQSPRTLSDGLGRPSPPDVRGAGEADAVGQGGQRPPSPATRDPEEPRRCVH